MSAEAVLQELEALGSEQTRKTYRRHGVGDNTYGVSYANLNQLKKRLKRNQPLAEALWVSGNHEARILALMIADPKQISAAKLDEWANELPNYVVAEALAGVAAQTPHAESCMARWIHSESEWIATAGWTLLAHLANQSKTLPDAFFESTLETITRDIHTSPNRVRYAMNSVVIAIGIRNEPLEAAALAAAKAIGPVEVDHGQTSCETPQAERYIAKAWARKRTPKG